jgi:plasmid maintenance system antidote protein VapI
VNASEREDTVVKQREFPILSTMPPPRDADERTLRRCDTEQDAIAVSIALSHVSQAEIARRMGIAKGYLTMLKKGERTLTSAMASAMCYATGSNLVRQYRTLQSAFRIAQGRAREADRIAAIASYSMQAVA